MMTTTTSIDSLQGPSTSTKTDVSSPEKSRGRPRRIREAAAECNITVRMTPAERDACASRADELGLGRSEYFRLQLLGTPRKMMPPTIVEVPSKIDADAYREIQRIGKNINQLTTVCSYFRLLHEEGRGIPPEALAILDELADWARTALRQVAPSDEGIMSRFASMVRDAIGRGASRS